MMTHCVILTEQMRQNKDPQYAFLLERLRVGNYTEESINNDYDLLNTRLIDINKEYDNKWQNAGICVGRNFFRECINKNKIEHYAINNHKKIYLCNAIDKPSNIQNKLTQNVLDQINILDESKTDNLMTQLPLIQDAEYFLTSNILTKYGYVNSARVIILSICIEDSDINNNTACNNNKIILHGQPKYLIIKLVNTDKTENEQLNILENDVFIIEPVERKFNVLKSDNSTKTISISRTQFSLSPTFSLTSYKIQGKTVDNLIVDLKKPNNRSLDFAYTYVALSRVRCLNDLMILRPFEKDILKVNIPEDLKDEMIRLKDIEKQTISTYNMLAKN